jgi:hypothetical protein
MECAQIKRRVASIRTKGVYPSFCIIILICLILDNMKYIVFTLCPWTLLNLEIYRSCQYGTCKRPCVGLFNIFLVPSGHYLVPAQTCCLRFVYLLFCCQMVKIPSFIFEVRPIHMTYLLPFLSQKGYFASQVRKMGYRQGRHRWEAKTGSNLFK